MKSLYRRYRPLKLEDVVGQEQVTKPLISALKSGKVSHAFLFIGPRGCGKTSVARILAHEVNGFKYQLEDDYVDIIEIDGASNRGIDNIRELREKAAIAPTTGKYKVYIIDEVHMLTKEAFNALLKTLEEPPAHVIFIMATTDAYKVPVTITSRAQTYTFKLADAKVMFDFLKDVTVKEKMAIADEALEIIAKRGGGSFRDSLSLLDQISTLSDKEITKEMVVAAMGLPQDEKVGELLTAYQSGDMAKITAVLQDLLASGVKAETLTEELISTIVTNPKPELLPLLSKLPEVKAPYAEAKLLVALAQTTTLLFGSGPRPAGPSPRAAGANPRAAALRNAPNPNNNAVNAKGYQEYSSRGLPEVTTEGEGARPVTTGASDPSPERNIPDSPTRFDWEGYVEKVKELSDAVHSQLVKTQFEYDGATLHIYPMRRIVKSILGRDNNKRILVSAANGVNITIHEADEIPSGTKKDATLNKISAIMGGEVENDEGGNPF